MSYQNSSNNSNSNSNNNNINNNSNSSNNTESSKKDDFRRYLERTNVIDSLTKVLVGLYEEPERPTNAIDYVRKYMGAPANIDVDSIKKENQDLRTQVERLSKKVEDLKHKLKGQQSR
mmetsp:Transcript_37664/g.43022  ORF Transcript_37664/g.43022 Transcript_37664/m.43022 type:complete len:118 (+) Transcript_37664:96-449(+)|eukprot:CAMPEP_0194178606 /NCGR_PEP_ID=MMETSP0154-20130528/12158_1 /TAXON_ID=1049557 /ORGANISM="Thalassiothrix antarctica, Strain L6-D1" /LENGTH=117 /DNA_ID=CAMNT_0038893597 /DNA_START=81 /DNA_END=434 /DNA_ORIENTATION=+